LFSVEILRRTPLTGGVFAVIPCQWWRIIGSYSGLTSEKYKNFIVRSFFRQNILNIVFSV
ncbi:hypothetical protein ACJEAW_004656, partial [Escherichia coli]